MSIACDNTLITCDLDLFNRGFSEINHQCAHQFDRVSDRPL